MPRTQIEKLWLGGAALAALLIAVIGYFFLVSPQRARTQDVQSQVAGAQLQAATLQTRITSLTSEQKKAASYRLALAQARAALPTLNDLSATPTLLKSLQGIAHASGTSVSSLTVGDPTATAPVATTPTSTASASPSSSPSSTPAAAGGVAAAPATSLYSVAVTASVSGTSTGLVDFLDRLQHHQPRAVLISAVAITGTAGGKSGGETMSITMTAFVRPSPTPTTATTGGPIAAAPSGATPSPTSTSTP